MQASTLTVAAPGSAGMGNNGETSPRARARSGRRAHMGFPMGRRALPAERRGAMSAPQEYPRRPPGQRAPLSPELIDLIERLDLPKRRSAVRRTHGCSECNSLLPQNGRPSPIVAAGQHRCRDGVSQLGALGCVAARWNHSAAAL